MCLCVSIVRAKVWSPSVFLLVRITPFGHWIQVATYGSEQGSQLKTPRVKMTTGGRYNIHICNMHNTSSSTVGQIFCLYAVCLTPLLSKNHTFCVKILIIPKACCCFLAEMFQICQNNDHLFCLYYFFI